MYKKLLAFLEKTLEDVDVLGTPRKEKGQEAVRTPTTSGRSTGRSTGGRKRNIEALDPDEEDVEVETPTKKRRAKDNVPATPTKSTGKKTVGFAGRVEASTSKGNKGPEAPDYVLPSTRKLCNAFKTLKMVPHVYTGVCVVLDLSRERPQAAETGLPAVAEQQKLDVLCLLVAVYLMTLTRMQKGLMTTQTYDAVSKRSVEMLGIEQKDLAAQAGIEDWIARINDGAWTTEQGKGKDWWSSVPEDVIVPLRPSIVQGQDGAADMADLDEDNEETPRANRSFKASAPNGIDARRKGLMRQLEEEDPDDVLLPGLGTMMNDAIDYLSDERTVEYELWKAEILRRVDSMENGGGSAKKRKGRTVAAAA